MSSGRVSSKQIGDELTNGWKTEKSDGKKNSKAEKPDLAERSNPTSRALDAPRVWPLLCFELSISVDQEERLLQSLKRYRVVLFTTSNIASFCTNPWLFASVDFNRWKTCPITGHS